MDKKKLKVIWQNDDVMVVNKPNGMICVRDETLKEWPVIAHRLDKETSGALLLAKNLKSLRWLMDQFKERKVDKEYVALVHGWIEPREGRVKLPLSSKRRGGVRKAIRYDGKMADTAWKMVKKFSKDGQKYSLLKIKIYTGRTHQIRVHLAHLGYPVYSDSQYLHRKQMWLDRQVLSRHFLHASKIEFSLLDGSKKEVEVELPNELSSFIDGLK